MMLAFSGLRKHYFYKKRVFILPLILLSVNRLLAKLELMLDKITM